LKPGFVPKPIALGCPFGKEAAAFVKLLAKPQKEFAHLISVFFTLRVAPRNLALTARTLPTQLHRDSEGDPDRYKAAITDRLEKTSRLRFHDRAIVKLRRFAVRMF
jgi:hypothetical protein